MSHAMLRSRLIVLLLSAFITNAIAPAAARAQTRHTGETGPQFTFSPFLGVRLGGRIAINTPNVDYLGIHSSFNGGFNLGARIMPGLYGEFMWNRQSTTLSAHDTQSNTMTTLTNHAHLDMYQASLLYEIPTHSQIVPFAVAGIGFTHFDSHGILSFDNRFSYNLGGGVKYLLTRQVAVRSELRKGKALEWLLDHVDLFDDEGNSMSRNDLRVDASKDDEVERIDEVEQIEETE